MGIVEKIRLEFEKPYIKSHMEYTFGQWCSDKVECFLNWSSRKTHIEDRMIAGWIMFLLILWCLLFVGGILLWWGFRKNMGQLVYTVNDVIKGGKILYFDNLAVR